MSLAVPNEEEAMSGVTPSSERGDDLIHVVPLLSDRGKDFLDGRIGADVYYDESRRRAREDAERELMERSACGSRVQRTSLAVVFALIFVGGGFVAFTSRDSIVLLASVNAALIVLAIGRPPWFKPDK